MASGFRLQILGQAAADLVQQQPDQRLGAIDVRWRHHEVERGWPLAANDVADSPVAAARDLRDDRIAVEAEKRHGGGQHAGALVVGFVEQLARSAGDDGMRSRLAEMRGPHHGAQRGFDRAFRIGEEAGDAGQRLVGLGIENMQDRTDEKRVARFLPMVPFVE